MTPILLTLILTAAVGTGGELPAPSTTTPPPPAASAPAAGQQEYRLGSGDLLEISIYPGKDLQGEYRISTAGEVLLPLVGRVKVAGLTVLGATDLLESKLRGGFYRDPQVVVSIKDYRSRRVSVLGAVNAPGAIVVYQPTRLLSVLSDAGGVRDKSASRLVLVRDGSVTDVTNVQTIGLSQLLDKGDLRENVWVYPGDMIYVPSGNQIYMLGAVEKPGAYAYQDGMTLLKVISLAGGLKPIAAQGRINLIRRLGGQEEHREIDAGDILSNEAPDVVLEPEDIIVVPEGFL